VKIIIRLFLLFERILSHFFFQDAKKGMLFIDFPPVLQLQLKRFEYDFVRDAMVKVCSWPLIFILASLRISLFHILYLYFGAYVGK